MTDQTFSPASSDELTLGLVVRLWWRGKGVIVLAAMVGLVLVSVWMKMGDPVYSAEMELAPPVQSGGGGADLRSSIESLAPLAGGLGSLVSMAGGGNVEFRRALALMTSNAVAVRVAQHDDVVRQMFYKAWDGDAHQWKKPSGPVFYLTRQINQFFGLPLFDHPGVQQIQKFLEGHVSVREDRMNGTALVVAHASSRAFAEQLLRLTHDEADSVLRQSVLQRTTEQVNYLRAKLDQPMPADERNGLIRLLISQEAQLMMAQTSVPFAADIVVHPIAQDAPVSPSPKLFMLLAMVLAGGLAGVGLVVRHVLSRHSDTVY